VKRRDLAKRLERLEGKTQDRERPPCLEDLLERADKIRRHNAAGGDPAGLVAARQRFSHGWRPPTGDPATDEASQQAGEDLNLAWAAACASCETRT
jgi:hypothetical protein